jgi:hypothetical protein
LSAVASTITIEPDLYVWRVNAGKGQTLRQRISAACQRACRDYEQSDQASDAHWF